MITKLLDIKNGRKNLDEYLIDNKTYCTKGVMKRTLKVIGIMIEAIND